MAEWSEDHVVDIGSLNSKVWFSGSWLNCRLDETLRWKVKTISWEGRKVVCRKSAPSRLYPRLSRLRTDGFTPWASIQTYRLHAGVYGSIKPSSRLSTEVWLSPLLHFLARERNWVRTHGSVSRRAVDYVGSLFSQSSDSVQHRRWCAKGYYVWIKWNTYGPGPYVDWAWKACGMLIEFFLAGCTSIWIVATLGYE
jgi:hypothetical protein